MRPYEKGKWMRPYEKGKWMRPYEKGKWMRPYEKKMPATMRIKLSLKSQKIPEW